MSARMQTTRRRVPLRLHQHQQKAPPVTRTPTCASPPSASEDVPAPEKSAAADTNARSPAAAAVQMGAATTL
eukprot:scaffold313143_cov15-Tisochrysis_lutea.AAC.1